MGLNGLLDLRNALMDPEQADIAVEAFDPLFGHIARTTVNLHGPVGDPAHSFRCMIFESGAFKADLVPRVERGGFRGRPDWSRIGTRHRSPRAIGPGGLSC